MVNTKRPRKSAPLLANEKSAQDSIVGGRVQLKGLDLTATGGRLADRPHHLRKHSGACARLRLWQLSSNQFMSTRCSTLSHERSSSPNAAMTSDERSLGRDDWRAYVALRRPLSLTIDAKVTPHSCRPASPRVHPKVSLRLSSIGHQSPYRQFAFQQDPSW